jgi:hypothetical protein
VAGDVELEVGYIMTLKIVDMTTFVLTDRYLAAPFRYLQGVDMTSLTWRDPRVNEMRSI